MTAYFHTPSRRSQQRLQWTYSVLLRTWWCNWLIGCLDSILLRLLPLVKTGVMWAWRKVVSYCWPSQNGRDYTVVGWRQEDKCGLVRRKSSLQRLNQGIFFYCVEESSRMVHKTKPNCTDRSAWKCFLSSHCFMNLLQNISFLHAWFNSALIHLFNSVFGESNKKLIPTLMHLMQSVIQSEPLWSVFAEHDVVRRGGESKRQLGEGWWKIWAVIRNNNKCWKVMQTTPSANLHYLLWGLAGLLANLFSVCVWEGRARQTWCQNPMI